MTRRAFPRWEGMGNVFRHGFTFQSLGVGAAVFLLLWLAGVGATDAMMFGWCAHVLLHATWCYRRLWCATPEHMRERAKAMAEGRWTVLGLALLATTVAAGTVIAELVVQQDNPVWEKALAVLTIVLSWCHVHVLFAIDYAHEYWLADQGLEFKGGDGTPEFSEFLYVALTVGATAQVSDTDTTSPGMRRAVMLHGIVSFAFNTAVLATSVNVLAGLAGGR